MTVGIPGAGIGGLFYLLAALLLPLRSLFRFFSGKRTSWKNVFGQFGLALGIFAGLWATGWLLGQMVVPAATFAAKAGQAAVRPPSSNFVRWAALFAGFITLGAVLLATQFARIIVRRKNMAASVFLFLLVGWGVVPAFAQSPAADLMKRADAAFADENRVLAEKLYLQAIARDPAQSRALYRLGVLAADDASALAWFRRYTEAEPGDAWGWLAVGDRLSELEKNVEAREAYEHAARLAPEADDIRKRLDRGRLRAAPAVEPLGGLISDSDGNTTWRYGGNIEAAIPGGFRVGGRLSRSVLTVGSGSVPPSPTDSTAARPSLEEAVFRISGRPWPGLRLDLAGGLARILGGNDQSWSTAQADVRLRWRAAKNGPAFEARGLRIPLAASPLLLFNRAMKNELRLGVDLPFGPLRIRWGGRIGAVYADKEKPNARYQGDAAIVLPLGWAGEISAQFHRLGFARASTAGYFAPAAAETVEAGTYWEWGGDRPFSASLDLGAGVQRLAKQGEVLGPWKPAFRAWAALNLKLSPSWEWRLEAEAYSAPFAPVGVVTSVDWRYLSIDTGIIIRVR